MTGHSRGEKKKTLAAGGTGEKNYLRLLKEEIELW